MFCKRDLLYFFNMVYFRSYWSHWDLSTTICLHQMAAVGLELTTLGFRGMAPYSLRHRCGHLYQDNFRPDSCAFLHCPTHLCTQWLVCGTLSTFLGFVCGPTHMPLSSDTTLWCCPPTPEFWYISFHHH